MSADRHWRLDVVTRAVSAVGTLDEKNSAALAKILGIESWQLDAVRADNKAPSTDGEMGQQTAARSAPARAVNTLEIETADPGAPDDTPPERTHFYRLPEPDFSDRPGWLDVARSLTLSAPRHTRTVPDLFPTTRARSVLGAAMKVTPAPDEVDLPALIEKLASAKPLLRLPKRPGWRIAQSVRVIMDTSGSMVPFRQDTRALLDAIRRILGPERIHVTATSGWPPQATKAPHPGAVVLIVSGLGMLPAGPTEAVANVADWAAFSTEMKRLGWTPIALTPASPADWPDTLPRALGTVHWSESTNARQARSGALGQRPRFAAQGAKGRREQLQKLAELASMSARLDRQTVRRLRLMVGGGPELEADLWWSKHVASRGETGITLENDARSALQTGFSGRKFRDMSLTALAQQHPKMPAHFAFEEAAIALVVTRPPGWTDTLRDHLRNATRTILEGGTEVRSFALWILKALTRLEIPTDLREDAAALYYAACKITGAVARRDEAPGSLRAPSWISQSTQVETSPNVALNVNWGPKGVSVTQDLSLEFSILYSNAEVPALCLGFSPDGQKIAVGCSNGATHVFGREGEAWQQLTAHTSHVSDITFTPDNKRLISAGGDGSLEQADISGDNLQGMRPVPDVPLLAIAAHPTGHQIAVSASNGPVYLLDLASGRVVTELPAAQSELAEHVAYTADGRYLFVARGTAIYRYDCANFAEPPRQTWSSVPQSSFALCEKGHCFLVGYADGTVSINDIETLDIRTWYTGTDDALISSLAAPDHGVWGAAGTARGEVAFFDLETGYEIAKESIGPTPIDDLAVDRDGSRLVALCNGLFILDVATHRTIVEDAETSKTHPIWRPAQAKVELPQGSDGWLRVAPDGNSERTRTLAPGNPPARLESGASWHDISTADESRFRLEDADQFAGRFPLHLGVVVHPQDRGRAGPVLDALEERIRAHAGLPDCAQVLQRDLFLSGQQSEDAIDHALRRAEGQAGIVVIGSRLLADHPSISNIATLTQRQPRIEIMQGENNQRDVLEIHRMILAQHPGHVRIRGASDNYEPGEPGTILVVPINRQTHKDTTYCNAVEHHMQRLKTLGIDHAVLPVRFDQNFALDEVAHGIPSLGPHQITELDQPDNMQDFTQLARRIRQLGDTLIREQILPIWLDDTGSAFFQAELQRSWPKWLHSNQLDEGARRITQAWRHGRLADPLGFPDDNPVVYGLGLCKILQDMTMTFHVDRFDPQINIADRDLPLSEIGLYESETSDAEISPERQKLEHFRILAEYFHWGPVSNFLETGIDPWLRPELEELETALTDQMEGVVNQGENPLRERLPKIGKAFERYATPHERSEFARLWGDLDNLREPRRFEETLQGGARGPVSTHGYHSLAALFQPYAAPGMDDFVTYIPTPVPPPVTFVEDVERYQGQFLVYLQALAGARPDTVAHVNADSWQSINLLRRLSIFNGLDQHFDEIGEGPKGSNTVSIPIDAFHDIASVLCGEIIKVVRHCHPRRHAGAPAGATSMA